MNLADIQPLEGTREWLNAEWIRQEDRDHVISQGSPNPYIDDTYDLYAGLAACLQPKTILEIGVYRGYSMAAMLKGSNGSVTVALGVDISLGGEGVTIGAIKKLRLAFPEVGIAYLEIDSQTDYERVPKGPFDIVHIDGDHSYEAATNDLKHYGPLCSEDGVVIVHDTVDKRVYQATLEFASRFGFEYRQIDNACGNILLTRKKAAC